MMFLDRISCLLLSHGSLLDLLSDFHARYRQLPRILPSLNKHKEILDFGAGLGLEAYQLSKQGYKVIAVDTDPALVAEVNKRLHPKFEYVSIEENQLKHRLCARAFGYVFMASVLHHIPRERQHPLLRTLQEFLEEDGEIILVEPKPRSLSSINDWLWDKIFCKDRFYGYLQITRGGNTEYTGNSQIIRIKKSEIAKLRINWT